MHVKARGHLSCCPSRAIHLGEGVHTHMRAYTRVHVCLVVHMCLCVYGDQRAIPGVFLNHPSPFLFSYFTYCILCAWIFCL